MKAWIALVAFTVFVGGMYYVYMGKDRTDIDLTEEKGTVNQYEVIGTSVEGREILAYRFGKGSRTFVLVGAIHGGYEWNTAILSYELIDHFTANPGVVPPNMEVVIIPVANPDGLYKVVGTSARFTPEDAPQFDYSNEIDPQGSVAAGRFNANDVDLNRNFDCEWKPNATWENTPVKAGSSAFSEPETRALRDFLLAESPEVVVFFHSANDGVYPNFCDAGPSREVLELTDLYSKASGYPFYDKFTNYEVTGAAESWLATQGISAITVELSTHKVIEFEKNLAGIKAMLGFYSETR